MTAVNRLSLFLCFNFVYSMFLHTFQTLPHPIIKEIIEFLGKDLTPLLWTCHGWWYFAIDHLCGTYNIEFDNAYPKIPIFNGPLLRPRDLKQPPIDSYISRIREAKCTFGFQHVFSGKIRLLVFESARSLCITFCYIPFKEEYNNAEVETDKLYRYIRHMVPNVSEVHISTMNYGYSISSGVEDNPTSGLLFKRLVRRLSEILTCHKLSIRNAFENDNTVYDHQLQLTTNLIRICLDGIMYCLNPHSFSANP